MSMSIEMRRVARARAAQVMGAKAAARLSTKQLKSFAWKVKGKARFKSSGIRIGPIGRRRRKLQGERKRRQAQNVLGKLRRAIRRGS